MKSLPFAAVVLAGLILSNSALADDDDCTDPVTEWQPREVLRQQLEQRGWTVQRIKVDDGCYEVRGVDNNGNTFKAKYEPASLRVIKMKTKYGKGEGSGEGPDMKNTKK